METPFVDPLVLVAYLLAEFDGSERIAAETRHAMLRAASGLPADHHALETIDRIASDLMVAVSAIENGGRIEAFQRNLGARWQGVLRQIRRASLH